MCTNYEEEKHTTDDKNRLTLIVKGVNKFCVNFAAMGEGGALVADNVLKIG